MQAATPAVLAIRQVRAFDPGRHLDAEVDIVVEGGRIARLFPGAAAAVSGPGVRVIDGAGKLLLPGLVEVHAHFREPGFEHKEDIATGLQAAAAGGYAHVCVMPNTRPVNDTPEVTRLMLQRARSLGGPALHVVGAVTQGLQGLQLTDMAALHAAGAVAFSDDGRCVVTGSVMREALQVARSLGVPLIQHAEDHSMTAQAQMHEGAVSRSLGIPGWPREAEDAIVARDLVLVQATGARYHLAHVSTAGSVQLLREARARGLDVTAEAAPHHLLLTHELLANLDAQAKVNPPLREPSDVQALREALADGTIDCVATDHAPHAAHEKSQPLSSAPPGMIGIEFCLSLMMTLVDEGVLSLARLVDALTASPARLIGLPSPALREGALAELCLFDPSAPFAIAAHSLHSKSKNTPFLGRQLKGRVLLCVAQGQVAFDEA